MASGLSIFSGIAKGYMQGKMGEQKRAQQQEMQALQKQMLQLQIAGQKTKQADQKMRQTVIDMIMQKIQQRGQAAEGTQTQTGQGQTGGQAGTKLPEVRGGASLPELMAIGGMPQEAQVFLGQGRLQETQKMNKFRQQDMQMRQLRQQNDQLLKILGMSRERRPSLQIEGPQGGVTSRQGGLKFPELGGPAFSRPDIQTKQPPIEIKRKLDPNTNQPFDVPINKRTGQEIGNRMPAGPVKGTSAEAAAKIALANQATQHIVKLKAMFITLGGGINKQLVWQSSLPMGGIGQGRMAMTLFKDALDARARAATGAAMPESEIRTYMQIYFPSVLDSDAVIKSKLKRLGAFMDDYLETLDPGSVIRKRLRKPKAGEIIESDIEVDFIFNPQTGKLEPAK